MKPETEDCFISVDVETSGPVPGLYSLLSIGACLVSDDSFRFHCFVQPISERADAAALGVTGLSMESLKLEGRQPEKAMGDFAEWVNNVSGSWAPVFVGLNAGFDWSFINYYFHCYHGSNPFGFAPLDIKALYMGVTGSSWRDSKSSKMKALLDPKTTGNHDALHDALAQAELFRLILDYPTSKSMRRV
jgi:DNA polymerase III epsilon subunit-like protein